MKPRRDGERDTVPHIATHFSGLFCSSVHYCSSHYAEVHGVDRGEIVELPQPEVFTLRTAKHSRAVAKFYQHCFSCLLNNSMAAFTRPALSSLVSQAFSIKMSKYYYDKSTAPPSLASCVCSALISNNTPVNLVTTSMLAYQIEAPHKPSQPRNYGIATSSSNGIYYFNSDSGKVCYG